MKKYQIRWMSRYNPTQFVHPSSLDAAYKPEKLSQENTVKLGKMFVEVDKQMKYGVSRQLIVETFEQMDLMKEELK